MAEATPSRAPARRRLLAAGGALAATALVATLAVVWTGYDARETPVEDAAVWALQTGEGRRYARVNTALGELETVKEVENPSAIAQDGGRVFLFTDADSRYAPVDPALPPVLDADAAADAFSATPAGTADVVTQGDHVAYRTEEGDVHVARLSTGGAATPVDPFADVVVAEDEEAPRLRAEAVAVTASGTAYAVSSTHGLVVVADAATGEVRDEIGVDLPASDALQVTAVGDAWAVLDAAEGRLWTSRSDDPIDLAVEQGARLQTPGPDADEVFVADAAGLVSARLDGSDTGRVLTATGTPAAPAAVDGTLFAAWLGAASGTLWSGAEGETPLDYAGEELTDDVTPVFAVNGRRAILNETASGWVWQVPGGALVPSSQQWSDEETTQQERNDRLESERVLEPKPPVAVDDAFGVRAGRDAPLSVLLNDHDPNEDVLGIDPASVTGLDPAFGTVRTTNDDQQLVLTVAPDAEGSATFRYRATDGTAADGLLSEPATVTVTVVPDEVNSAPVWCGVDGCLAEWPAPQVAPGGTTSVDVLDAWVDPEGDPIYLAAAVNTSGLGAVAADPGGTVTYQHPDPQADAAATAPIALTVSDVHGATAERSLSVSIVPAPELTAAGFTVTGAAGAPLAVDVAPHVTGATDAPVLDAVTVLDDGAGTATTTGAALSFVFQAAAPGSYTVQYTVRGGSGDASAIARVVLVDPAEAPLSTPPLTAFVRPGEDATVDVLGAVHNPGGRVLLTRDLRPEPLTGATLSVDTVDQRDIRVSGGTDDGLPGTLGTVRYTVTDGTGSETGSTTGELTVVLLPAASAEPPIAVDDRVTVRAGAQVDIPALANDTAPQSAIIAIDPATVVNESGAGLAFATPRLVRYLAPEQAGTYSLSYTIYRLGFPELTDTARVFVTVLPTDRNSAPAPSDLVGRVLSGASVTIPFSGYGADPDGDAVTLDRVVTQPEKGSAALSPDGTALVYTSAPDAAGQDAFTFRVRDGRGGTGEATARIGILDAMSDPSPVTYSDYAQAQAGPDSTVVLRPADNDVDPAGGGLELLDVRPGVPADSAEYDVLAGMIAELDRDAGTVRMTAGTVLGTFSFTYTVRNRAGDTAQGLLILKVVREAVPDHPVVTDTLLGPEDLEDLADGVDVLSGKVTWTTGEVSGLRLALWGDPDGFTASGRRISGEPPQRTTLVPFSVTGTAFDGREVVSYGFLRVPGEDDIPLSLRAAYASVTVDEGGAVDVDLAAAVTVPAGRTLEVGTVAASGARPAASCTVASGTTVRYAAGAGAPWTDVCTVAVRLTTQEEWTYLPLRISITAEAPQPELRAASVSVSPGDSVDYDLATMTTWPGRSDLTGVTHATAYDGDQFTVVQTGGRLSVSPRDDARPGREESVVVRLPSHPDTAAATLTLVVGPAPTTLPKGATVTEQCSQGAGRTSCTVTVIGGAGEVNPLPGTPLSLVSVTSPANCPRVTFTRASDTAVTASWSADAPGGAGCAGSFTVRDAQQRTSAGERAGTLILDLQGLPADPARLTWTGYTGSSVTLRAVAETGSYPAVTGFRVRGSNGTEVTCAANGECPALPARAGEQVTYEARAVNAVGESRSAVSLTAWAYAAPEAPASVTSTPTGDGTARVSVTTTDPSTGGVALRLGGEEIARKAVGGAGTVDFDIAVRSNTGVTVTAVPTTSHTVPPASVVAGGSAEGRTRSVEAWGVGAPAVAISFAAQATGSYRGTVTVTGTVAEANARSGDLLFGFAWQAEPCVPSQRVDGVTGSARSAPYTVTLRAKRTYKVCAAYVYDGRTFASTTVQEDYRLDGAIPDPDGDATYTIVLGGAAGDLQRTARLTRGPALRIDDTSAYEIRYSAGGGASTTDVAALLNGLTAATPVTARTCLVEDPSSCSDGVRLRATDAAYPVSVTFSAVCGEAPRVAHPGSGTPTPAGDWSFTAPTPDDPTATVTFRGALDALGATSYVHTDCAAPEPEPEPEPDPGAGEGTEP